MTNRYAPGMPLPMNWERDPVYGGCRYHTDNGITVIGDYDKDQFEAECNEWTVSGSPPLHGRVFETSDQAILEVERLHSEGIYA